MHACECIATSNFEFSQKVFYSLGIIGQVQLKILKHLMQEEDKMPSQLGNET